MPKRFTDKLVPVVSNIIYNDAFNDGEGLINYFEMSPYYFDEYTLHGTRHISAVLEYADKLIPENVYNMLTNNDISVLVLGVFLHDLGMFIKESGLRHLLQHESKEIYDASTGNSSTWKELWDNHINKLKHASGKELDDIFGESEHIFDVSSHQVCASFIRTYHHQIAYHIAIHGFPGVITHNSLSGLNNKDYIRLVGILAKSHGVSLRSLSKEIDDFGYDNNLPLNIPIYYLMAILRLADLLDANGNRAPKILSDMNEFSSSRSQNEWTLNQLITGRQWPEQTGKPETLKLIASPTNSIQFLELKSWFEYWQKELDLSWAIIGETHNDRYKLSIRRITSNIFNSTYDFVTNAITLKVNPDIVKLLVAPLYGDDPSFGVRELLQNAIDACNERTELDGTVGEIDVNVDEKTGVFTIIDNGIGMSENVIGDYYLCAGASYRYSSRWSETFLDKDNNPKIARTGRFGIGALATFLIGNKAKVTTRHINDIKGYCFEYTVEPNILNVTRVEKFQPGTTIEISMKEKALKELTKSYTHNWTEWYHFGTPNIHFKVNGTEIKQKKLYNLRKGEDSDDWFSYESSDYDSFHWSVTNYITGRFMCNGIHIPNSQRSYRYDPLKESLTKRGYFGIVPYISVVDKKGTFPVDLARKTVFDTFSFDDNLVVELCRRKLAYLLVKGEDDKNCIFNKKGFIPKERSFVANIALPVYLIGKDTPIFEAIDNFKKHDMAVGFFEANKKRYLKNIEDKIVGEDLDSSLVVTEIWVNNSVINIPKTVGNLPPDNMIHTIDETEQWRKSLPIPASIIGKNINLVVKYIPSPIEKSENNIMFDVIQELLPNHINGGWIPYDTKERERMYHDTYKKLERYIKVLQK